MHHVAEVRLNNVGVRLKKPMRDNIEHTIRILVSLNLSRRRISGNQPEPIMRDFRLVSQVIYRGRVLIRRYFSYRENTEQELT
jgi:hypothetical protein